MCRSFEEETVSWVGMEKYMAQPAVSWAQASVLGRREGRNEGRERHTALDLRDRLVHIPSVLHL
jgi:hypothetical protein